MTVKSTVRFSRFPTPNLLVRPQPASSPSPACGRRWPGGPDEGAFHTGPDPSTRTLSRKRKMVPRLHGCTTVMLAGTALPTPAGPDDTCPRPAAARSEEHTSELQSLMRTSYA